jgi:hypothetical protein
MREERQASRSFSVPLQGAREASLTLNHGIGRVELRSGPLGSDFLTGTSAVAMNHSSHLVGDRLEVSVDAGPSWIPFLGPEDGIWNFRLNPSVSTILTLHAGASQLDLDLTDLHVTRFDYEGGASSLDLRLPAGVDRFVAKIQTGAASLHMRVPQGVAARLFIKAVGTATIDEHRFVSRGAGLFQSADYDLNPKQAEITIEGGATSIRID